MLNGLAHYALGSRERATVYLEAFQRLQNHSPATKLLAQLYVADSRADKAADVLEAYLRARPDDAQAMILLASALMSRGQDARAASLMTKALERRDVPEFRTVLGLSLLRSGQTGNALDVLDSYKSGWDRMQAAQSMGLGAEKDLQNRRRGHVRQSRHRPR